MKLILISIAIVAVAAIPALSQTNESKAVAPDKDTIAVVLGKTITIKDKDRLNELIFGALLEQYAKENKIEPTEAELDAFVQKTEEMKKQHHAKFEKDRDNLLKELKSKSLTEHERTEKTSRLKTLENILKASKEVDEKAKGMEEKMQMMRRNMARHFVKSWKINKSLYEKYGGRIIFQQAGVEPLDAYREFLKEQEKKGAFKIFGKDYEISFWKYFINDSMHTFYLKEDGAKFMKTPWWLMDKPVGE
jgi:pyruvate/2-oxoglutarate dehydrogenase complex dihydrolipoamide acyltransferase (E2) component